MENNNPAEPTTRDAEQSMRSAKPKNQQRSRKTFCHFLIWAGWPVATLFAAFVLHNRFDRARAWIPALDRTLFENEVAERAKEIRNVKWGDTRPLQVWCGDSHVELGNWYDLSAGSSAIRNVGLSRARVRHVETLIAAVPENPERVILLCGINDLAAEHITVEETIGSYINLLKTTKKQAPGAKLYVLAVMPVASGFGAERSKQINSKVALFNRELQKLCATQRLTFVPVPRTLLDHNDALRNEFTLDGLHLNQSGYKTLYEGVRPVISI